MYARPLLDEAAAPAVHPPPEAGVPDVVGDQEEQDEGQQGGRQQLQIKLSFGKFIIFGFVIIRFTQFQMNQLTLKIIPLTVFEVA